MHKYSLYKHDTTLNSSGTDTPLRTHPLMSKSAVNTTSHWIQKQLWPPALGSQHGWMPCTREGFSTALPPPTPPAPHTVPAEGKEETQQYSSQKNESSRPLPQRKHGALGAIQRMMRNSVVTMERNRFRSNTFSSAILSSEDAWLPRHQPLLGEGYTVTTRRVLTPAKWQEVSPPSFQKVPGSRKWNTILSSVSSEHSVSFDFSM